LSNKTDNIKNNSVKQLDRLIEALDHQLLEDKTIGKEEQAVFHEADADLIRLYLDAIRIRALISQGIPCENEGSVPWEATSDYEPYRDV